MTIARKYIIDTQAAGFITALIAVYPKRFTGQALRRTLLCGVDELTDHNYFHRKNWLESRMLELCDIVARQLCTMTPNVA